MSCPRCSSQTNGGRGICIYCGGNRTGAKGNGAYNFSAQAPAADMPTKTSPNNAGQWHGNNAPGAERNQQWSGNNNAPNGGGQWGGNNFNAPGGGQQWNGNNAPGAERNQQWNGNNAPGGGQQWGGNNNAPNGGGQWGGNSFNAQDNSQPWDGSQDANNDWNYPQASSDPGVCKGFPVAIAAGVIVLIKIVIGLLFRYTEGNEILYRINMFLNGAIFNQSGDIAFLSGPLIIAAIINLGLFVMCVVAIALGGRGRKSGERYAKTAMALGIIFLIIPSFITLIQII